MLRSNVTVDVFSIFIGFFLENSLGFCITTGDFNVDPNFLTDLQGVKTFIDGLWFKIGDAPLIDVLLFL